MWKQFLSRTVAGVVLIYTGVSGLSRFPEEFRESSNLLQRLTEIGVLGYGASGAVAAIALLFRHRWAVPAALVWAASVVLAGGLAPVAFGGTSVLIGLGSAAVSALVAAAVVWLTRVGARQRPASPSAAPEP